MTDPKTTPPTTSLDDLNAFLNPTADKKPGVDDKRIDLIQNFLDSVPKAMNFEHIDGFFCALICGPEPVPPGEFLPHIFGGQMPVFASAEQANEIMDILLEHWNYIAEALAGGISYYPFLYADQDDKISAHDWADGFMLGVQLREAGWADLMNPESEEAMLAEIVELRNEISDFRQGRGFTISSEDRDEMVGKIVAKLQMMFDHYADKREQHQA